MCRHVVANEASLRVEYVDVIGIFVAAPAYLVFARISKQSVRSHLDVALHNTQN
ncbi:hypothetical protein SODALDRAFT_327681, partial [Sodiomyces alkalinus F11]